MTEEKKKRVNSKGKGAGFELKMCKTLNEVLAPMNFRRSQSSGAILGGVNSRFRKTFSDSAAALFVSDVVPTNEDDVIKAEGWKCRFSIECKFYKEQDSLDVMFGDTGKILRWFDQAAEDAAKLSKEPIVIFKFNRTETYCAVDTNVTKLPENISTSMNLVYNQTVPSRNITIFLLKEALLDVSWWKKLVN